MGSLINEFEALVKKAESLSVVDRIQFLNKVRLLLHNISPFASEPVDCVLWIAGDRVEANDYNPNAVAPPEMRLLEHSIREDGYTQPIVAWYKDECYEVVDGFHRNHVGKECEDIHERLCGYLPITVIRPDREGVNDRVAATIRHNRARGKHQVGAMSDIVSDLAKRCWSDKKIARELGMEPDEVLRLKQITGLVEVFADREFSEAWEAGDIEDV